MEFSTPVIVITVILIIGYIIHALLEIFPWGEGSLGKLILYLVLAAPFAILAWVLTIMAVEGFMLVVLGIAFAFVAVGEGWH